MIPGYADHYCSGGVNLTLELLDHIKAHKDKDSTYSEFFQSYVERVLNTIDHNLTGFLKDMRRCVNGSGMLLSGVMMIIM